MTMWTVSPDSVEPDLWTELATMTAMYCGTLSGGPELLPGSLIQPAPHCGGCPVPSAKPLKLAGAEPPLNELPVAELPSPMTKAPLPRNAKVSVETVCLDGR